MKKIKTFLALCLGLTITIQAQTYDFALHLAKAQNVKIIDVARDDSGNYYIICSFYGSNLPDLDPSASVVNPPDPFDHASDDFFADALLAKYDNDGNYLWSRAAYTTTAGLGGGDSGLRFTDVEVNSNGDVLVLGGIKGGARFTSGFQVAGATTVSSTHERAFIQGYSSTGTDILQIDTGGSQISAGASGEAMHIDASDNIYITGEFMDDVFGLDGHFDPVMSYYAKYNSSGVLQQAINTLNVAYNSGTPNDSKDIYVDGSGNVYVTGVFEGTTDFDPSTGTSTFTGESSGDTYIAKYSSSGTLTWKSHVNNNTGLELGYEIEPLSDGNLVLRRYDANDGHGLVECNATNGSISSIVDVSYALNDVFVSADDNLYLTGKDNGIVFEKRSSAGVQEYSYTIGSTNTLNYGARIIESSGIVDLFAFQKTTGDLDPTTGTASTVGEGSIMVRFDENDNVWPTLSSKSPTDDNQSVAINDNIVLTFSEDVKWGAGKIRLYDSKGAITDYSNSQNTSRVTISNNVVTIDPQENFEYNLDYYITIEDDAILDIAGNAYAGFSSETSWNFKTVSIGQAPTDIQISANSFDEDTPSSTFLADVTGSDPDGNLNYFELLDMTASGTAYDDFYLSNGKLYVGYGDYDYATKSSYAIRIQAVDDHNNTFEKDFTLYVNDPNPDNEGPTVLSTTPADDATNVDVNFGTYVLHMSEPVKVADAPGIAGTNYFLELARGPLGSTHQLIKRFDVQNSNDVEIDGSTITLKKIPQLDHNTAHWVRYYAPTPAITDEAGNAMQQYISTNAFPFTTEAVSPPVLQSKSPHNVSTVAVDASFVLQFDESVQPGPENINPGIWLRYGAASMAISLIDHAVFNGSEITITPPNELLYDQDYYIEIPSGVIRDLEGTSYAGLTGNTEWYFTTEAEPLAPTNLSPVNGADNVPVGDDLVLTFPENADIGSGSLAIYRASDNDFIRSWSNFNGSTMTIDGTTVTFHQPSDLPANTEMYVQVSDGYLRADADANNTWVGINDNTTWRFTTGAENPAPSVQSLGPAHLSTGVNLDSDLVLTASEDIFMTGSANILILQGSTPVKSIPTDDASIEVNGATLTITGALNDLDYETEYWVFVPGYVLSDDTGKYLPETSNSIWRFITSKEYMQVLSFSPTGTTEQPRATEFSITFDRDISLTSGAERLYIYPAGSHSAVGALSKGDFEIDGATATAVSSVWLDSDQEYYVTMDEGLFLEAADPTVENTQITADANWNFTTRINDGNGPMPQTYSPANGATKVSRLGSEVSFDITYNEPVFLGATNQNVTLYREEGASDFLYYNVGSGATLSEDGRTVSFHIPSHYTMHYDKEYYILMNATTNLGKPVIFDADGNGVPGITDDQAWRFTTHETAQITSFTPAAGTTVPVDTEISFELNNDIDVMSGPVYLKYYATNGTVATINMPSADAVADGNKVTFDFGELEEGTHYWVQIPNSSFRDEFNQTFSADDRDTWHFYTEDITKPTVLTTTPGQDDTDVSLSNIIEVEWSETIIASVSAGAPITIVDATNDQVLETITSNARIDVQNGNLLRINPENDLSEQILIEVHITEGVVKDAADNLAEAYDWSFTTGDFTAPTIASLSPMHEATGVAIDADLVLTFSEEVQNGGGYIRVKEVGGSPVKVSGRIDSNPDQFTLSGNKLTIHLANANLGALAHGVSYYVQIDNSAIQDHAGNYFAGISDDATTWKFTIEKEVQTIAITPIADRLTTDGAFDVQATTTSNLALSYNVISGPATNSGKTITPTGESGNVVIEVSQAGNDYYYPATETVSFRITDPSKDDQTITFAIADQVYGGVVALNGSTDSGLPITYELLSGPATRSDNQLSLTGVGSVVVRATADGDDTYNPAEPVELTFDVSKATLTVTANDKSKTYSESNPELTFEYDGFVNGDDESALSEIPEVSTAATDVSDAGEYAITLGGGTADNYALTLVNGTLTIEKATATVTLSDLTFDEDGTAKSPTVVTDPAELTVVLTYDGASEAPSEAGTYEVVATIDEINYSGSVTATLTINENTITGVQSTARSISVYPNPTSDWLAVSGLTDRVAQLSLLDIEGRVVLSQAIVPAQRIHVTDLKAGIYMLQLVQKDITTTTKILIH